MVAAGSAFSLIPSPGSLASEDLAFLVSWRPGAVVQGLWDTVSAPAVLLHCKLSPSQFTSHWVFLRKAVALPCSLGWTLGGFQWNSCRVQMQAAFSDFSPPPLALDSWCGDLRVPPNTGDRGLIPGSGRSLEEGNGYPLEYSCLENPTDRGAWWAKSMVSHRVGHD